MKLNQSSLKAYNKYGHLSYTRDGAKAFSPHFSYGCVIEEKQQMFCRRVLLCKAWY